MRELTYAQAINEGIRDEMRREARMMIMGEDVGKYGGVFGVTRGLFDEFHEDSARRQIAQCRDPGKLPSRAESHRPAIQRQQRRLRADADRVRDPDARRVAGRRDRLRLRHARAEAQR